MKYFWCLIILCSCWSGPSTQSDPFPDNLSQLSRCELSCLDLRAVCGDYRIDYNVCLLECAEANGETELLQVERSNKCFSENSECNPMLYSQICIMDGGT